MNLYNIQSKYLELLNELEENLGELTPELEEQLAITESEFYDSIKNYADILRKIGDDVTSCTAEIKRLEQLIENKNKTYNSLSKIIIDAIERFGDTKKSGVKYIDYGTGELSVSITKAIEVNKQTLASMDMRLNDMIWSKSKPDYEKLYELGLNEDEINDVKLNLQIEVPLTDFNDTFLTQTISDFKEKTDKLKVNSNVSKMKVKERMKSALPDYSSNLTKQVTNKHLKIK